MAAPDWWNRRIRPKYKELAAALRPSLILDELLSEDLITLEDFNNFHQVDRTELERTRRLLTGILPFCEEDRLDKFCKVLATINGQEHVLGLIGQRTESHQEGQRIESLESTSGRHIGLSETGRLVQQPVSIRKRSDLSQRASAFGGREDQCLGNAAAAKSSKKLDVRRNPLAPDVSRVCSQTPKEMEFNKLCYAVQRHGSSRWLALGLALGYTIDQANTLTGNIFNPADKLQVLLDKTAEAHGHDLAIRAIQRACQEIASPIFGAVNDELSRHQ